ncbi:hypothetical protein [Leptolyngbya sp. FACHB-16]|uniref:hypothetical protein n=1 Tax=unclassified Leptolyngbya TaxID=2650499 RepID=UPI001682417D|nr:hypothetical protein [Leptolyngbya sp. FACHB-16]MBD2156260.1 hypothetical protein [Leptolyngbya sp. FACHB-16]
MKRTLIWIAIVGVVISVLQYAAAVEQDGRGTARDFADEAEKGAQLYQQCFNEKIQSACDELSRLQESQKN